MVCLKESKGTEKRRRRRRGRRRRKVVGGMKLKVHASLIEVTNL